MDRNAFLEPLVSVLQLRTCVTLYTSSSDSVFYWLFFLVRIIVEKLLIIG